MSRARWRNVARLSVLLVPALALASGCAALLGMESATCTDCSPNTGLAGLAPADDTMDGTAAGDGTPDAGTAGAPAALPATPEPTDGCEAYCQRMATTCDDSTLVAERPYMNRAACLAVCRHIPAGSAGDSSGNTLACRTTLLQSSEAQSEPALVCAAAGRGGQAGMTPVCGSNCDAYCSYLASVCPERLPALAEECSAACAQVPDRFAFDATLDRAGNTVQCRLWHVGVAAECDTEECRIRHCGHAVGIDDCLPAP